MPSPGKFSDLIGVIISPIGNFSNLIGFAKLSIGGFFKIIDQCGLPPGSFSRQRADKMTLAFMEKDGCWKLHTLPAFDLSVFFNSYIFNF